MENNQQQTFHRTTILLWKKWLQKKLIFPPNCWPTFGLLLLALSDTFEAARCNIFPDVLLSNLSPCSPLCLVLPLCVKVATASRSYDGPVGRLAGPLPPSTRTGCDETGITCGRLALKGGWKKRQNADLEVAFSGPFCETLPGRAAAAVTEATCEDNLLQVMSVALTWTNH